MLSFQITTDHSACLALFQNLIDCHVSVQIVFISAIVFNLTKLFGEQGPQNKISYTKWSRQIKDLIESKGAGGMELSQAMHWAASIGRNNSFPRQPKGGPGRIGGGTTSPPFQGRAFGPEGRRKAGGREPVH